MNDKQKLSNQAEIQKTATRQDPAGSGPILGDGDAFSINRRQDFLRQLGGIATTTLTVSANLPRLARAASASSKPLRASSLGDVGGPVGLEVFTETCSRSLGGQEQMR
jgi:hypothetical protein